MKQLRSIQKWIDEYETLATAVGDLEVLLEFQKAGEATTEEVDALHETIETLFEDLEFKNMLSDEGDSMSAVLQITAGAGGTESCDWAQMLMRMYLMWSEKTAIKYGNSIISPETWPA